MSRKDGCISTRLHGDLWRSCIFECLRGPSFCRPPTPKCRLGARPCTPAKCTADGWDFKANLQAYKKARRNRRAYLHQLMSVLMTKGTLVDINTRCPVIRVFLPYRPLGCGRYTVYQKGEFCERVLPCLSGRVNLGIIILPIPRKMRGHTIDLESEEEV